MKTLFCLLAASLLSAHCFCQRERQVSAYASFNITQTLYDRTISNNSVGFGAGAMFFMRTKGWARPALDISSEAFGGTKELYLTGDGKPIYAKDGVVTVFGGVYIQSSGRLFAQFTAGPAFFNSHAYLGIKPSIGYYLVKGRQLAVKASFTNVFQHDDISSKPWGYCSFSLAIKLF